MLKFPRALDEDTHAVLKWAYLSATGCIVRYKGLFAARAKGKWHTFDASDVKYAKAEGFLTITRSTSKTGRESKMLPGDLYVEELALTPIGEALGSVCAQLDEVFYIIKAGEVVYGSLRDFGYLYLDSVCLSVGSTRRHLLRGLAPGSRLRMKPNPTKYNADGLGLFTLEGNFLGNVRTYDVGAWWLDFARFRSQQIVVEVTAVSVGSVSAHVIARTTSPKHKALPEDADSVLLADAL